MVDRYTDPPSSGTDRRKGNDPGHGHRRLNPEQCEIKIRWDRARKVLDVTSAGVAFEFDMPLKVGSRYPISVNAPGISISSTLEVSRCQVTVDPSAGRFFRVEGRFFPYVE